MAQIHKYINKCLRFSLSKGYQQPLWLDTLLWPKGHWSNSYSPWSVPEHDTEVQYCHNTVCYNTFANKWKGHFLDIQTYILFKFYINIFFHSVITVCNYISIHLLVMFPHFYSCCLHSFIIIIFFIIMFANFSWFYMILPSVKHFAICR